MKIYIMSSMGQIITRKTRFKLCSNEGGHITQPFIQAQIKEKSKLRVTGLCVGNSPVTGEFPAKMASNVENFPFDDVIIW